MFYWLAERAARNPDTPALIYNDQVWTYAALNDQVAAMAARLAAAGVQVGDHIAVLLPNRPETVFLIHAAARMGCVLVPQNTRLTVEELRWQLGESDAAFLICGKETEQAAAELTGGAWQTFTVDTAGESGIPSLMDFSAASASGWREGRKLAPRAVQGIVFTSGTTGKPKGAMITFANHFHSAVGSADRLGLQAAARWLLCMPLYHVGGLSIVLRCCLYGTTVVLQDGFDEQAVSDALDRDAITLVSLVPTMLGRLLDLRGDDAPFPEAVRCVLLGGAAASAQLIERCLAGNIPIALTYGLTEACSQVATATPRETRAKAGSVGKALSGTKIQIVNDAGDVLPPGEIGMILVSGDTVMRGYYGQPEATCEVLDENWLRTGDLGYKDEDGDLWIVQRRTDLIVSGGENVYPAEIEAVLTAHPAIAAACVVGVDDSEWGQRVTALIETRGAAVTEAEILAYCREHLAGYKLPRSIVFTDALPCTASGKVQRGKAAELVQNHLLLES